MNRKFIEPSTQILRRLEQRAVALNIRDEVESLRALLGQLDRFRTELLELATFPEIEAAWLAFDRGVSVSRLEDLAKTHQPTIARNQAEIKALKEQLESEKKARASLERELKRVQQKLEKTENALDQSRMKNPDAMQRLLDERPPSKSQASRR